MWTISNIKQIAFVIITYITNAYISNKASYPTVAYWPRHSECCNQNLCCLVLSWFLGASKGYDRNWPSLSNITTLRRTQYKICGNGSVQIPFGLMTDPYGSSLNVKRCLPPMAVTTTPFCQRQRHPHYYSLLCSMVQNIADFLSCRIVFAVFLTDRYIG